MSAQPRKHIVLQPAGKLVHFACFRHRHHTCDFIAADIAFFPETVKLINPGGGPVDCERKTLYRSIVMLLACGAIARRGERRRGPLQRRVVGDAELPILREPRQCGNVALARSRWTMASRAAISSALDSCSTSQPLFSQSAKPMLVPDQKDLVALQHPAQEMIPGRKLGAKFSRREDRRIDFTADQFLRAAERFRSFCK